MSAKPIYVVSGGTGASGEQLLHTALAQFESNHIPVRIVGQVRDDAQLRRIVTDAANTGALIAHTLVNAELREVLITVAHDHQVNEIDLIESLLNELQFHLDRKPLGQPGLYRKLREYDLRRIEAIEFAVAHDDGQRIEDLPQAEIVLTGVSRVGKTPLSIYLSTLGWKVANIPLVNGIPPSELLFEIDRDRVVGLTMAAGQLIAYRQRRQKHIGTSVGMPYSEPRELVDELDFAQQIFRRGQFASIDMTDKPIEESAQEIVAMVTRRLASKHPEASHHV